VAGFAATPLAHVLKGAARGYTTSSAVSFSTVDVFAMQWVNAGPIASQSPQGGMSIVFSGK
jgi:hypothetical protein